MTFLPTTHELCNNNGDTKLYLLMNFIPVFCSPKKNGSITHFFIALFLFGVDSFIIDEKLMKKSSIAPLLNKAKELTAIFYKSRKTAKGE